MRKKVCNTIRSFLTVFAVISFGILKTGAVSILFGGELYAKEYKEYEKAEKELIRLEDEAGRIKSEIISLEKEIENIKLKIEKNKKTSDDIRQEISNIIKVLYFISLEKKLNHFLLKDIETKNIRYGEYIKSLISKYDENLQKIAVLNEEYRQQADELNSRLAKSVQAKQVLDRKIGEIYQFMEIKNSNLVKTGKEEKRLLMSAKEESVKKIDEVTKRGNVASEKEDSGERVSAFSIIWPVRQGDVLREYGGYYDESMNLEKFSRGIIIKAPFLSEVYAVSDAKVLFSGWLKGFGNTVILEHSQGFISVYSHLARAEVSKGDIVKERDIIGFVGDTGSNEGVILYFELRKNGKAVDPMNYIK